MAKVQLFTCFDGTHDDDLRVLFVGQSKLPNTPWEIVDQSVKAVSPDWEADARRRIRRAQQVAVLCGEHTDTATGVNKEIRIAREESKPYFLLKGRKDKECKKPTAAKSTDKMYKWTWENVNTLVSGGR